jgi:hypothetical protein
MKELTEKQRTTSQNKAIHKLFGEVANEMLDQGIERHTVMQDLEGYSCPIDAGFIKEVWRAIMYTQTGLQSTTQLSTAQIDKVYETFNRFLSDEYGIYVPFPSMDSLATAYLDNEQYQ